MAWRKDRTARRIRRIIEAHVIVDFRQQYAAKTFRQRVQALIFRTARLAKTLNFIVDSALAGADFIALHDSFAFTLQQLLEIFGDVLA
jgi:FKBP-type peptidyl-prolyl cis-trans isomerase 2